MWQDLIGLAVIGGIFLLMFRGGGCCGGHNHGGHDHENSQGQPENIENTHLMFTPMNKRSKLLLTINLRSSVIMSEVE